ncbi:hypothetical protein IRP63_05285 [Clostridium botulinum]|uniref:Uncharacterized protein n=1 Tax=Clostridium botulinum C/D str. DC5 TaxID=1443128 RepID=A0A0A0IL89_CLOBO|nr:hypothetical protein [Clostridium botulinum]KGN00331.1 hypothetical protein Z955_03895 [Clostridium botulinum C/D str. DC5]KOC51337.1 hypothetical protein ADU89_13820 [Clostridium botulinum]KOC53701.1 hypothetical protein ADU90_13200 [Clostridium botulinum]MCD3299070.1 hypothetical protein [Clostridium botulinum D/C]MCD3305558.1 hypothetical protein [Clostridium botulinum D/C]
MLNVYILERNDSFGYDEYVEQTIVAETEERAIKLASKEYGEWIVTKKVNLDKEQVLTKDFNAG